MVERTFTVSSVYRVLTFSVVKEITLTSGLAPAVRAMSSSGIVHGNDNLSFSYRNSLMQCNSCVEIYISEATRIAFAFRLDDVLKVELTMLFIQSTRN